MSSRLQRIMGIALALVLGLTALSGGAAAAHPAANVQAQATGTLTGLVYSADNVPLAGIHLAVYNQPNTVQDRQPIATTDSGADGRYSISVPAGRVWMAVLTQDIRGESFWGYDRQPADVAAGATLTDQDFVIAIRVVATPPPPTPEPTPPPPVGMPSSGQPFPAPTALVLTLLLLIGAGLVLRRRTAASR
jgi:hypothetical protein